MLTSVNSSLDIPFTFSLWMKPSNGLFLAGFRDAPCVSYTSAIFILAATLSVLFSVECNTPIFNISLLLLDDIDFNIPNSIDLFDILNLIIRIYWENR